MFFGQTATQFWALPQTWMPPGAIRASSRSPAFIWPVPWRVEQHRLADRRGADEAFVVRGVLAGREVGVALAGVARELRSCRTAGRLRRSSRRSCTRRAGSAFPATRATRAGRGRGRSSRRPRSRPSPFRARGTSGCDRRTGRAAPGTCDIGRSSISPGWSSRMRSTSVEQAWRVRPLTSIVQAPQTSSRQLQSQATGVVLLAFVGRGLGGDLLQHADDVEIRLVGNPMPLPMLRLAGRVLAEDADRERSCRHDDSLLVRHDSVILRRCRSRHGPAWRVLSAAISRLLRSLRRRPGRRAAGAGGMRMVSTSS